MISFQDIVSSQIGRSKSEVEHHLVAWVLTPTKHQCGKLRKLPEERSI